MLFLLYVPVLFSGDSAPASAQVWVQARANIERAGASRAGYFIPNVATTIGGAPWHAFIIQESLTISLALNEEPDTARFTLKPGATPPSIKQPVTIGLGTIENPIFAGQVDRIVTRRREGNFGRPFHDVECIDWSRLFNRRLITRAWESVSASDIALTILVEYTDGFTGYGVQLGLPVPEAVFVCVNEPPLTALRRLISLIGGGGVYITPGRDVRLFDINGDQMPGAPTNPVQLTNALSTLQAFASTREGTQLRNRIIAEGMSWPVMIDVPIGATSLPIQVGWGFDAVGTNQARIGTTIVFYSDLSQILGPPSGVVLTDAAIGATSIAFVDVAAFAIYPPDGLTMWAHDSGGNLFSYTSVNTGADTLTGIPASGYGSITAVIPAGTPVYQQDAMNLSFPISSAVQSGAPVTYRLNIGNATEQTALAAIEGGDGIHEHHLSLPEAYSDGVLAVAQSELNAFSDAYGLLAADWLTRDMNALPGTQQVINFTGDDPLLATLTIIQVELTFPSQNKPPFRRCRGGSFWQLWLADLAAYVERDA